MRSITSSPHQEDSNGKQDHDYKCMHVYPQGTVYLGLENNMEMRAGRDFM